MEEDIQNALLILKAGGLILYPTDTVWGIGCDATNSQAVSKIYQLKNRADSKALISLISSTHQLKKLVGKIDTSISKLMNEEKKPVTFIFGNVKGLAPNATASDGSAAIRVTGEKFSKELCSRFGKPIISTSANLSGEATPRSFIEIDDYIKKGVEYIVKFGRSSASSDPSKIVKVKSDGSMEIIRD